MAPYDLLLLLTAGVALVTAFVIALGGNFFSALKILVATAAALILYISCVYCATGSPPNA